jgi:hypothetical protein
MSEIDLISFTSSPKINANVNVFAVEVSDLLNESFDKSFKFDANNNSANTTFKAQAQPTNSFIERADNLTQMFSPSQTLSADDSRQDLLNLSNSIYCEDLLDFGHNNITTKAVLKVPEVVLVSDKKDNDDDDASAKDSTTDTACLLDNFDFIEVNSAADGEEFW